jgi:hypothetical protein
MGVFFMEADMTKADELRKNAENCSELAKTSDSAPIKKRFERLAAGWESVAKTQDWLDGDIKEAEQRSR